MKTEERLGIPSVASADAMAEPPRAKPGERLPCQVYIGLAKAVYILGMIRRNEMSVGEALRKITRRLVNAPFNSRGRQEVNI